METREAVISINPMYADDKFNLEYRVATAEAYARKLDKLPRPQMEAVALFHVLHGLSREPRERRAIKAAIDRSIVRWYPNATAGGTA